MGKRRSPAPISQPAATAERGEHELVLGEVTYRLRPSYAAMRAIESKTEQALIALLRLGNAGNLSLDQLGVIAAELIRAGAEDELTRNVGAARIAELIYEQGVPSVTGRITACLVDAVSGGRTTEGNVKAASATKSPAGVA